jgi:hypothetical protein
MLETALELPDCTSLTTHDRASRLPLASQNCHSPVKIRIKDRILRAYSPDRRYPFVCV